MNTSRSKGAPCDTGKLSTLRLSSTKSDVMTLDPEEPLSIPARAWGTLTSSHGDIAEECNDHGPGCWGGCCSLNSVEPMSCWLRSLGIPPSAVVLACVAVRRLLDDELSTLPWSADRYLLTPRTTKTHYSAACEPHSAR
jgi:hypothetical protein